MSTLNIALLPGDGIGPEVLAEGVKVLHAAQAALGGFTLNFETCDAGVVAYRRTGSPLPETTLELCKNAHAIYFGSVGLPGVMFPDGTEVGVEAGLQLRFQLDLYANVRPIRLYPNVRTRLRAEPGSIDYVILRENIEGLYASRGGGNVVRDQIATDTMVISRSGTERIARFAFDLARGRAGAPADGRSRVTCVDKANILRSYGFFRKVFDEVARGYHEIEPDHAYMDAMACWLVTQPERYDVVVSENMFGDILTDLGAATVGGMGMSPSAEIGERHALFQGSHGSAPTIAGQGIANPMATIVSGAMMLDWLADRTGANALKHAAQQIEHAVLATFEDGVLTTDVGGDAGTAAFGDAVAARVRKAAG